MRLGDDRKNEVNEVNANRAVGRSRVDAVRAFEICVFAMTHLRVNGVKEETGERFGWFDEERSMERSAPGTIGERVLLTREKCTTKKSG